MAYLKADEVRKMNGDDRVKTLRDLRQELVHERGVAAMGGSPPSPGKIRQIRRQIARILTIQNEERLGIRDQAEKKFTPEKRADVPAPTKGPAARAAQMAHAARKAREPKPMAPAMKPKPATAAPKKSGAKKPAAPAKAAANKAAKGAASKAKKEE